MTKIIYALIGLLVVLVVIHIFFSDVDGLSQDHQEVSGYVFSIEDDRLLVAEGLTSGVSEYSGNIEELQGEAYYFSVTNDTKINDQQGNDISLSDLDVNGMVSVTVAGSVMESYPAQATASSITKEGEMYEVSEAVTRGYIFSMDGDRILVAEGLSDGVQEYTGEIDELEGNAVWFTIDEDTEITDTEGDELAMDDISINILVDVHSTGPMLLSYPAQSGADRIVVTGEQFDS